MTSASLFERTWDTAIELCRKGSIRGQVFSALVVGGDARLGATSGARSAESGQSVESATTVQELRWAVTDLQGQVVFAPTPEEAQEAVGLFAVARRFVELETSHETSDPPPPYDGEPRRTFMDSLREWGLVNDDGSIKKAWEYDPEPLLGYVVRVGNIYAYGVVKQSVLSTGTINPTGACESADEARRRASELLMLALVRGATVMGMNGVPAVIDLSAEPEES